MNDGVLAMPLELHGGDFPRLNKSSGKWFYEGKQVLGHIHIHQDPDPLMQRWSDVGDGGNDIETIRTHEGLLFFLMNSRRELLGLRYSGSTNDWRTLKGPNNLKVDVLLDGDLKLIPAIRQYYRTRYK